MLRTRLAELSVPLTAACSCVCLACSSQLSGNARAERLVVTISIIDINPGPATSFAFDFTAVGDRIFFVAEDGTYAGQELWVSDGTASGTHLVEDINPGGPPRRIFRQPDPPRPRDLTALGDRLLFVADDGVHGDQPWSSDGETTQMLGTTGSGSSGAFGFAALSERLALFSPPASTASLWRTDGTPAGTQQVKQVIRWLGVPFMGRYVFSGSDGRKSTQLWTSDGSAAGTYKLSDLDPADDEGSPFGFRPLGDRLYFLLGGTFRSAVWRTDGVGLAEEVVRLPGRAAVMGRLRDELFVAMDDAAVGRELFALDARGRLRLVKDIRPGAASSSPGSAAVVLGDRLFFAADDGEHGTELWVSEGTEASTRLVADIAPGTTPSIPIFLTVAAGRVWFWASNFESGMELWNSDGTARGTSLVRDAVPGSGSSNPSAMAAAGSKLFLQGYSPETGGELLVLDLR